MNLKKSDKIIAIMGVIILIVAAVGIILLAPGNNKNEEVSEPKVEYSEYDVSRDIKSVSTEPTTVDVKDKIIGNDVQSIEYVVPTTAAPTLMNVDVFIEFTDKNSGLFGFGKLLTGLFGTDTLYVSLLDADGTEIASGQLGKNAENVTLSTTSNAPLNIGTIRAKSPSDAREMLDEEVRNQTAGSTSISYQIQYQLDEKETILRPFMWLREKIFGRDTFTYTVTCNYYDYSIKDINTEGSNDDNGEMGLSQESNSNPKNPDKVVSVENYNFANVFKTLGRSSGRT